MCIRFPHWPLQRVRSTLPAPERGPIVLYRESPRAGERVAFCSQSARRAGVESGMSVAEAKALLESRRALIVPDDPPQNVAGLQCEAGWCRRFSPAVGLDDCDEPDSLLADVTGCGPLFGGEQPLAAQVAREFRRKGFAVQVALADTPGAAWAVAHFRCGLNRSAVLPPGAHRALLPHLPAEALRLGASAVAILHELNVRRIGQLQGLPRATLPSRVGPDVLCRLDQAFGAIPESIVPVIPAEPLIERFDFDPPTEGGVAVSRVVDRLLEKAVRRLQPHNTGLRQLRIALECAGGENRELLLGTVRPSADLAHWRELIAVRLERTHLPGKVHRITLEAAATSPLESRQHDFFDAQRDGERRDFARLVDRLSSRLGAERIARPVLLPEAQPERAVGWENVECRKSNDEGMTKPECPNPGHSFFRISSLPARPLQVERRPVAVEVTSVVPDGPPVRLGRGNGAQRIVRHWGPERIQTGWWRGGQVRRDYYRVETESGLQLWLFREPDGGWFLHGTFA